MQCPPEILRAVTEILRWGLLRIRAAGWQGDARRCAIEANHLHNLPSLIASYSPDLLKYYLEVEQPCFLKESDGADLHLYETAWRTLAEAVKRPPGA